MVSYRVEEWLRRLLVLRKRLLQSFSAKRNKTRQAEVELPIRNLCEDMTRIFDGLRAMPGVVAP